MLSARLLGASHLETAAGDEGHSDRGAGETRKRGLVLHPSEVGVAGDMEERAQSGRQTQMGGGTAQLKAWEAET